MNDAEAIEECERWFARLEWQKHKAQEMQRAAALARAGNRDEALRIKRSIDLSPTVYDGANLEKAVRHLLKRHKALTQESE